MTCGEGIKAFLSLSHQFLWIPSAKCFLDAKRYCRQFSHIFSLGSPQTCVVNVMMAEFISILEPRIEFAQLESGGASPWSSLSLKSDVFLFYFPSFHYNRLGIILQGHFSYVPLIKTTEDLGF